MIGIYIGLFISGGFIYGCVWAYYQKKADWNNGACPCGKGFWKSFDMCSGGETGYSCTACDRTIWI